ncbi:MAG: SDR family NAD(P)-dependent oxidoreductase [Propionibacteriaceae bacterium]|nr:SDR family NAD(P)-dependent oxidoreductase [Propionibacteriaceae bacterium]
MTPIDPAQIRPLVCGKVAVVTGASRGIGAEMARRLVTVGATVIGVARSGDDLTRLSRSLPGPGRLVPLPGDLRDTTWAGDTAASIVEQYGAPTLLVSNAGHSIRRSLAETTGRFHDVARTAAVNYLGAVALAMPILDAMRERGQGHLVYVATTSLDMPMPDWASYTASKAAFEYWLRCVAPELRAANVAVTSVHLPRVATAMSAPTAGRYRAGRFRVPELSVAQAANLLCRAIVQRPRFVRPVWAGLAGVVAAGWPGGVDAVFEAVWRAGLRP